MKRVSWALLLIFLQVGIVHAQPDATEHVLVYFSEKPPCLAENLDFHAKAIERRAKLGIPFPQTLDCPVDPELVRKVGAVVDSVCHSLRWLNAVSVEANAKQLEQVLKIAGVSKIEALSQQPAILTGITMPKKKADPGELETLLALQRERMGMDDQPARMNGKGVRIAVLDAGFAGADEHPAFQKLFDNNQVVATKDFYAGKKNVYRHSGHGTAVLSCIAGEYKGKAIGAAPKAEFLLARTEHGLWEKIREEDAWLAAMEWADQQGADIISSSLGYGIKRYTYEDMDGQTTIVSRAAATAVRLGILVVVSAGNSGRNSFHYLNAPADADSVLTVGACYPMFNFPMPYSSFGPNARRIAKPDVAAPGYVVGAHRNGTFNSFPGTSFACPLIAGFAACLMQENPDSSNMAIHRMILQMGHLYPYFDYTMGHGVPSFTWIDSPKPQSEVPTFQVQQRNDTTFFVFNPKTMPQDTSNKNGYPFHLSFQQLDGSLSDFLNLRIPPNTSAYAFPNEKRSPGKLRAWFQGYLYEE